MTHRDDRDGERASKLVWLLPLGAVAALVVLYFVWPAYRDFVRQGYEVVASEDQQRIERWIRGYDPWGWVVLVGLMLFQAVVAFLPSIATMVASVLAYGPFLGGALAWGGMVVAATLGYGIGRALGPVTVEKLIGTKSRKKLEGAVERYGIWVIVIARISPILSTDAVSIVAGLAKMRFWHFIVATAVGTLPLVILIAALGVEVAALEVGLIVISLISLVIFIGYAIWDRRRGGGRRGGATKTAGAAAE